MPALDQDLIAAVATAAGQGGIGIVRLSGPGALDVATAICSRPLKPRYAQHCRFTDGDDLLDEGLALYFPAPRSFTGEDVVELHGHGGPVVLQRILRTVCARGARVARAGEFSERAFHNGKLDLAQAEAIADLISCASVAAARAAVNSLTGRFSDQINDLAREVLQLRVLVEAAIDFPDEDIEIIQQEGIDARTTELLERLGGVLETSRQGALLAQGISIALLGEPNVGKSSLLNILAGEEAAIVTDIPGTTRDLLKVDLVLDGVPVRLVDTAGLREARDAVEEIGIARAREQAGRADLVLWVVEATSFDATALPPVAQEKYVTVINKIDLLADQPASFPATRLPDAAFAVSAKTGEGIDALRRGLLERIGFSHGEVPYTARARHVQALQLAQDGLVEANAGIRQGAAVELVAESLRAAHDALGEIIGTVSADDLLGKIFSEFCIGK